MNISCYFFRRGLSGLSGFVIYRIQSDSAFYAKNNPRHPLNLRLKNQ